MNRRAWIAGLASLSAPALLPYPTRNLLAHYDTQQGAVNFANNGNTWLDLSGNGHHATVPAGWDTPQLVADPLNGQPGLHMSANAGFKTRLALPPTAFIFCVVNVATVPTTPDYGVLSTLWDEVDNNLRYGIYLNYGVFKIAKGGGYGEYAIRGTGLRTLAWDGLLLADNNTDFVGTGIGNPQQVVNGLTIGNAAGGQLAADAYWRNFLVYSETPTSQEVAQLVANAHNNFLIPS